MEHGPRAAFFPNLCHLFYTCRAHGLNQAWCPSSPARDERSSSSSTARCSHGARLASCMPGARSASPSELDMDALCIPPVPTVASSGDPFPMARPSWLAGLQLAQPRAAGYSHSFPQAPCFSSALFAPSLFLLSSSPCAGSLHRELHIPSPSRVLASCCHSPWPSSIPAYFPASRAHAQLLAVRLPLHINGPNSDSLHTLFSHRAFLLAIVAP
jgi:hypothetical protein